MNILTIIRLAKKIERPPDVEQEQQFREWCGETIRVLNQIVQHIDDAKERADAQKDVDTLAAIHSEDVLWDPAYDILRMASHYITETDQRAAVTNSSSGANELLELWIAASKR